MSYDFFVDFCIESKEDVNNLTQGSGRYTEIRDVLSRILLLNTVFGIQEKFPDKIGRPNKLDPKVYAKVGEGDYPSGLKALIHSNGNYNDYLRCKLSELNLLGINMPVEIANLPKWSWVIEFPITLRKPFISKDDVPLYIIENPVRKDKVFGVPFTSAMAWKGNLRWTMMKIFLEKETKDPEKFAEIRYQHILLFGTEKGMEEIAKGWTKYLDDLCPEAKSKLKERFGSEDFPSLTGMLYFYPTFWDRIDMEVINPHDRETKTGKNPIYFEVVPAGSKGYFRLLYVPFYYLTKPFNEIKELVLKDLQDITSGLKEMMLTYGFSAKKSSGYGVVKDDWDKKTSRLVINGILDDRKFGNFEDLENEIKKLRRNM
ncbi:RAMP superfamily CRISPR-associated protein [Caldisericum exile]|uniref:RAMP superfamily CRISPR-associated protein n=1 Tax=Caldisericum exile TaxID=693075 RepID=UPI003C7426C0